MTRPYTDLPALAEIVLEESWVLGVGAAYRQVRLRLDLVLTERHPRYQRPASDARFCTVRGTLVLSGVDRLTWVDQLGPPATDATGEIDHGHVDVMTVEGRRHHLEGDFGVMDVDADELHVVLDDA